MRRDIELHQGAIDVGSWVMANRELFRPLEILRVDPEVIVDYTGELFIRLTVVLEDPDEDWPAGAITALHKAVQDRTLFEHDALAHVDPLARSTDEAA